jgi:glycosyltransferase involved in cell wall biosynthesis
MPQSGFKSFKPIAVSVVMPVMDETVSLRRTVQIVMDENPHEDIHEIICVVSRFTAAKSLEICRELEAAYPGVVWMRQQNRPHLGGAVQDAFEWAAGTHILLMASDLETDPHAVKTLIATAREGWDIVAATRWTKRGGFDGYNPVKLVANWAFQRTIGILYRTQLTDLTYAFRIWRAEVLRGHAWEELRHPFLLECLLRPLLMDATATEIPGRWVARTEGESRSPFWRTFLYFRIALKLWFRGRNKLPAKSTAEVNL